MTITGIGTFSPIGHYEGESNKNNIFYSNIFDLSIIAENTATYTTNSSGMKSLTVKDNGGYPTGENFVEVTRDQLNDFGYLISIGFDVGKKEGE